MGLFASHPRAHTRIAFFAHPHACVRPRSCQQLFSLTHSTPHHPRTSSQWKSLDPKKCGVRIWRIEKFLVVPWPKKKYGKFFNGDSYIILNTYKSKGGKGAIAWDVSAWGSWFDA